MILWYAPSWWEFIPSQSLLASPVWSQSFTSHMMNHLSQQALVVIKAKSVPDWLVLCIQPSQQQRQHSLLGASLLPAHVLKVCSPSPHMQVASAMAISISSDFSSWWEHMHLGQKPNSLLDFTEQQGPKQLMLHYQQGPHLSTGSSDICPLAIQSKPNRKRSWSLKSCSFPSSRLASICCLPTHEKYLLSPGS